MACNMGQLYKKGRIQFSEFAMLPQAWYRDKPTLPKAHVLYYMLWNTKG